MTQEKEKEEEINCQVVLSSLLSFHSQTGENRHLRRMGEKKEKGKRSPREEEKRGVCDVTPSETTTKKERGRGRTLNPVQESREGEKKGEGEKRKDRVGGAKSSRQIGLTRLYYPPGTSKPDNPAHPSPPSKKEGRKEEEDVFEFIARCLGSEGIEGKEGEGKKGRKGTEREKQEKRRRGFLFLPSFSPFGFLCCTSLFSFSPSPLLLLLATTTASSNFLPI